MILRISDRYIIRSFLYSLFICFVSIVSLFAVVDTFTNLPGILADWRRSGAAVSSLPLVVLEMNVVRLPLILYELCPALTLSAAMFTIVRLRRSNEITPLLASGVSLYRVLWPIFLMAILLSVFQVADREILIPMFGPRIYQWDRIRNKDFARRRTQAMLEDAYGNVIFSGIYHVESKTQQHAQMTRYWREGLRLPREILNAEHAQWVETPLKGWVYSQGTDIEYDDAGNVIRQSSFGDQGRFVPLLPEGAGQLPSGLATDVTPARLETKEVDIFYRPTLYLLEYAHHHGLRNDIALDINRRVASPLTNIILLLVGLPFALKRGMKSPLLGAAMAVAITGAYFAVGLLCENFALQGRFLTPLTGAWAPIIIFGPVGALLFDTIES